MMKPINNWHKYSFQSVMLIHSLHSLPSIRHPRHLLTVTKACWLYPQAGDNSIHLRDINQGIVFRWGVINWDGWWGGKGTRWKLNVSGKDGSAGLVYALNPAAASICLGALCWNCGAAGGRRVSQWAPGAWVLLFCPPSISLWSLWACHLQLKLRCTLCSWDAQPCRAWCDPAAVRCGVL